MDHYLKEEWPRATLTLKKERADGTYAAEVFTVIGYSIIPPGAPEGWIMLQLPSGGIVFKKLSNYNVVVLDTGVQAIIANNARREQQQQQGPPPLPGSGIIRPN